MNRNVESHFANLPQVDIQRSVFDKSHRHLTTFNAGDLIPIYWEEILPGDTVSLTSSKVVRLQTLLTPIFDNVYLDTYFFFVPNRLLWTHWKEFCGENNQSAWLPEVQYTLPKIAFHTKVKPGHVADYLGCPTDKQISPNVSCLPFRAYNQICNDFFRSDVLTDPLNLIHGDANINYTDATEHGGVPFKVARYHDYFSSALPSPQRGEAVQIGTSSIPVSIPPKSLPVVPLAGNDGFVPDKYFHRDFDVSQPYTQTFTKGSVNERYGRLYQDPFAESVHSRNVITYENGYTPGTLEPIHLANLHAVVTEPIPVTMANVNDLRMAFAIQKFLERDARAGGGRYPEYLKSHYGVISPDASLQRPQYLGGNRIALNVRQVANQSQADNAFLGDLGAMSHTQDVHHDFMHSFTEHGILMGVCCVRYDHTYSQGLYRGFLRDTLYDFYDPLFASLGEMPIRMHEIYASAPNIAVEQNYVFGYQEAWAEYRYSNNRVSSEMRTGIDGSLDSWHLADYYAELPHLSDGWIRESKSNIDRVLSVTSQNANQILADFYFDAKFTRPMPMYSIPGLIDHH
ncbi:major capsid protein [Capybara microvirus Cap1_SP_166]|nr:major capsid protein [Capybara microvirus Cap1_SP_166]